MSLVSLSLTLSYISISLSLSVHLSLSCLLGFKLGLNWLLDFKLGLSLRGRGFGLLQLGFAFQGFDFRILVIGGKDLDLHHLFVEVTSCGGIGRVLGEKKWKEVTATFNFPSSATNASFILRKYYLSVLQHYEQVYYFKAKGWTESADASHKVPTVSVSCHGMDSSVLPSTNVQETQMQPQMDTTQSLPGVVPANPAPPTVIGVIGAKFESGYLVTVTVGSETLRGVLYQTPQSAASDQVKQQISTGRNTNENTATTGVQRRKRRKKCEMKKRDPAHPKPNRSGYNFFFAEQHARLKPLYPGKDRDISKMIGELWNKLNEPGKAVEVKKFGILSNWQREYTMEDILIQLKKEMSAPYNRKLAQPPQGICF